MSWTFRIPHRDLAEPLNAKAIGELPRALENPDERAVARELMVQMRLVGAETVGQCVWAVEDASASERRRLLSALRKKAGLESIESIEARRRYEAASAAGRLRASKNSGFQLCHADGCTQIPLSEVGIPCTTSVRRWFCPEHRHLAEPGDMEPRGSGIKIAESGALVPVDEEDEAREAEAAASRRRQLEQQDAAREIETAELAAGEQIRNDAFRRELPDRFFG